MYKNVVGPTHRAGHTLDVVITRESSNFLQGSPSIVNSCLGDPLGNLTCDHYAVCFNVNIGRPGRIRKQITFRKFRSINVPHFIKDIWRCDELQKVDTPLDELVEAYNRCLATLINRHAPEKTKYITLRPNAPWYTDRLREAKQKRRRAERLWRSTKLSIHWQLFRKQCRQVNKLLFTEKKTYYFNKIVECGNNRKQLFSMTRQIMGLQGDLSLPRHSDLDALAHRFNDYFINKINEIRDKFDMSIKFENIMRTDNIFDGHILERFVPASKDEVRELILRAPLLFC
ncbi:hypothetical protein HOLleu_04841 [Holothuria leucospilota]|uniref:Uncharacterized protein n=1 Tax=Holothuria leucospilota TaxID=206669 RepID=A0A9Q1HIM4_HOLLE|nr:hypothetical protein HOLleu_04841 [Holothuria leucospilota]